MTSPALHRGKEKPIPQPRSSGGWMARAGLGTILGGILMAFTAFFASKKDLALGFWAGSFFWVFSFYALNVLTHRVLKTPERGLGLFWFWNIIRIALIALICWLFLQVSPACLMGALGSYLWFILVLGWVHWRAASPKTFKQ
jgi:hypothetical protein